MLSKDFIDKPENRFFNEDCIIGAQRHIADGSIDLIITDPPYGIRGDTLHKHYNRKERFVVDGYVEIPQEEYADFSMRWIKEADRILRPGGSIYIVSGYSNLVDILNALKKTSLKEINHIVWKYNFGVYTRAKYVSSHYHILFYEKPGGKRTFNTHSRYGMTEKDTEGGSANYLDREDVWIINREYKPGQKKNKNELPAQLLIKMLQYSSNEGDTVCDLFLGGFSTAKTAIGLNRNAVGFELNREMFNYQTKEVEKLVPGCLLRTIREPEENIVISNYGKPWNKEEKETCRSRFEELYRNTKSKKKAIAHLSSEIGRGYFSILKILDSCDFQKEKKQPQLL
ncbi:MAG: site-specific DNA-methyltransferase [Parcubacteria group bacterium]|nr:site-specific DNA-methyltransferase [Parcubacteria group bacterium]